MASRGLVVLREAHFAVPDLTAAAESLSPLQLSARALLTSLLPLPPAQAPAGRASSRTSWSPEPPPSPSLTWPTCCGRWPRCTTSRRARCWLRCSWRPPGWRPACRPRCGCSRGAVGVQAPLVDIWRECGAGCCVLAGVKQVPISTCAVCWQV